MTYKVLVATRSFGSTSNRPWEVLSQAGCDVNRADMSQKMTEERLIELLRGVDGAIVGVVPMTSRVMQASPSLRVVSVHGVGYDHVDLMAAKQLGVTVANCPGANDQAVADLTIGLMIAVARRIPIADSSLRSGAWGGNIGTELWNKTLGLVGLGRIGRGVAKRAAGFDMRVLAFDPYVSPDMARQVGAELLPLGEVIINADFLSLHAVLTDESRGMIGRAELASMKSSAYLINTSRGALVDEDALYEALRDQKIAGAALDTFIAEPPIGSPLIGLENVVLTPHLGGHTKEAVDRVGVMAAENVVRALQTGEPLHRVV